MKGFLSHCNFNITPSKHIFLFCKIFCKTKSIVHYYHVSSDFYGVLNFVLTQELVMSTIFISLLQSGIFIIILIYQIISKGKTPYLFQMRLELMAQLSNFLPAYNFTNDKRFSLTALQCLHYVVNVSCV